MATALGPEFLTGPSEEERVFRAELATDALRLLEDAEVAVASGEPEHVVVALVKAIEGLVVQLRDRVLDGVVASSPAPDHWPL
ncbi:hypothetical protein J2Z21_000018 [Streptomyces griseochromogenes]|uniref:Uncharacterized protein n=1 Tax=Streptomyces griseochromogenes TaxID=68214 RepID=A0ABS4LI78_9ACTN|nr:hypothetical protein [Streptomyces griseochromogenes]MBP2047096.1 hypothetical protein [Streptomyces griseochromogenes]